MSTHASPTRLPFRAAAAPVPAAPSRPFADLPGLAPRQGTSGGRGHEFARIRVTAAHSEAAAGPRGAFPVPATAPIQMKGRKKRQAARQAKAEARGEAYADRMKQRLRDKALGRSVRQTIDARNPLRSTAADRHLVAMDGQEDPDWSQRRAAPDQVAWSRSVQATLHMLPEGYTPTVRPMAPGPAGLTTFNRAQREVAIRYNPEDADQEDRNTRIGQLASTFTHELAVHGSTGGVTDPDEEHNDMHAPGARDRYLAASHRTFNILDNPAQQTAFAREWHTDMKDQISEAENLSSGQVKAREKWALARRNSMIDASARPEKHRWTRDEHEDEA